MIKVIFFDLGGVLFDNGFKIFIDKFSKRYNLNPKRILEVMDGPLGSGYREGKIDKKSFWESVLEELGIEADIDDLNQEWIDQYHINESVKKIILELRDKLPIFYLSDSVPERVKVLDERYGFLSLFRGGVFSFEAKARKPSREIFAKALTLTDKNPEEILFIDDKQSSIDQAQEFGLQTILFTDSLDLEKKLKEIGVYEK